MVRIETTKGEGEPRPPLLLFLLVLPDGAAAPSGPLALLPSHLHLCAAPHVPSWVLTLVVMI